MRRKVETSLVSIHTLCCARRPATLCLSVPSSVVLLRRASVGSSAFASDATVGVAEVGPPLATPRDFIGAASSSSSALVRDRQSSQGRASSESLPDKHSSGSQRHTDAVKLREDQYRGSPLSLQGRLAASTRLQEVFEEISNAGADGTSVRGDVSALCSGDGCGDAGVDSGDGAVADINDSDATLLARWSPMNLATAWHKLASHAGDNHKMGSSRGTAEENHRARNALQQAVDTLAAATGQRPWFVFKPREVANVVRAWAQLRHKQPGILDSVAQHVNRHSGDFSTRDLAFITRAAGLLRWVSGSVAEQLLLPAIELEADRRIDEFDGQSISNLICALGTLGTSSAGAATLAIRLSGQFQVADRLAEVTPAGLVNSLRSLARLHARDRQKLEAVCRGARSRLDDFNVRDLSTIVYALGYLQFCHDELLSDVCELAIHRLPQFGPQSVANMVHGFGQLRFQHDEFVSAVASQMTAPSRLAACEDRHVSSILYSMQLLRHRNDGLLLAVCNDATLRLGEWDARSICTLVFALGGLGAPPHLGLLRAVGQVLNQGILDRRFRDRPSVGKIVSGIGGKNSSSVELNVQDLTCLLHGLAQLTFRHGRRLLWPRDIWAADARQQHLPCSS
eukprot:TRINITY_DN30357_c0_g1_i1.p1 TRINITY_DN30357_c0_g1~~TRINITY_DN30357_c0_g1_i1.p1  ORF type:complete len:624 (-),score=78.53 TRINITY_DN30357_c0_g1_i1:243-2114(-)